MDLQKYGKNSNWLEFKKPNRLLSAFDEVIIYIDMFFRTRAI